MYVEIISSIHKVPFKEMVGELNFPADFNKNSAQKDKSVLGSNGFMDRLILINFNQNLYEVIWGLWTGCLPACGICALCRCRTGVRFGIMVHIKIHFRYAENKFKLFILMEISCFSIVTDAKKLRVKSFSGKCSIHQALCCKALCCSVTICYKIH